MTIGSELINKVPGRVLKASMTLNTPLAIIVAALIIGGCVLGSAYLDRYQIATTVSAGTPIAWKLNKHTGKLVACELAVNPNPFEQMDTTDNPVNKVVVQCADQ
jgi:hypothetical protein